MAAGNEPELRMHLCLRRGHVVYFEDPRFAGAFGERLSYRGDRLERKILSHEHGVSVEG